MGRPRDRGSGLVGPSMGWKIAIGCIGLALLVTIQPALTVTQATLGRQASMDVVADEAGVVGLDVASDQQFRQVEPMVDITNQFGVPMTASVELTGNDAGSDLLFLDNTGVGSSVTVTISPGSSETIQIQVPCNGFLQCLFGSRTVTFEVSAVVEGTRARATRSVTVRGLWR